MGSERERKSRKIVKKPTAKLSKPTGSAPPQQSRQKQSPAKPEAAGKRKPMAGKTVKLPASARKASVVAKPPAKSADSKKALSSSDPGSGKAKAKSLKTSRLIKTTASNDVKKTVGAKSGSRSGKTDIGNTGRSRRSDVPKGRGSDKSGERLSPSARRRKAQSFEPGFFNLTVKFALSVTLVIGVVTTFIGYKIGEQSTVVLSQQIDVDGMTLAKLFGAVGGEYYQDIMADESRRQQWVLNFCTHAVNGSDTKTFKSDIHDVLIYVAKTSASGAAPEKSEIMSQVPMSTGRYNTNLTKIDDGKWRSATIVRNGKSYPVDDLYYADSFIESVNCRVFRAEIKNKYGVHVGYAFVYMSSGRIGEQASALLGDVAKYSILGMLFGLIVGVGLSMVVVRPVKQLFQDVLIVSEQGDLDHKTEPHGNDEIGLLARAFNDMTHNLNVAFKEQAEAAVREQEAKHDLNIATEIQEKLLPDVIPEDESFDLHAFYRPSKDVGGDYYDFVDVDDDNLGIIVADVSGKSIPGAMVMTMARNIFRMAAVDNLKPSEVLKKVNFYLAKDIRRGMFVTAMYGIYNFEKKTLTLASAGHNPGVIYRGDTKKIELVNPRGMALGFDRGPIFDKTIDETVIELRKDDRVLLYTDGVVEAMNSSREEYTEEAMVKFVEDNPSCGSDDFVNGLVDELEEHRGNAAQHDDITIASFVVK